MSAEKDKPTPPQVFAAWLAAKRDAEPDKAKREWLHRLLGNVRKLC